MILYFPPPQARGKYIVVCFDLICCKTIRLPNDGGYQSRKNFLRVVRKIVAVGFTVAVIVSGIAVFISVSGITVFISVSGIAVFVSVSGITVDVIAVIPPQNGKLFFLDLTAYRADSRFGAG